MRWWGRGERDPVGEPTPGQPDTRPLTGSPSPALASRLRSGNDAQSGGKIGMAVRFEGADVVVVDVQHGGPAQAAGVLAGDVLLSIANEVQSGAVEEKESAL